MEHNRKRRGILQPAWSNWTEQKNEVEEESRTITAKLCSFALCATLVLTNAIVTAAPAAAQICAGDCNGDRSVGVDEIVLGVRIALGDAPIGDCAAMDGDRDGAVSVNELVAAITQVLQGCGGQINDSALAASARVVTEPIFGLFDFQARIGTPGGVAGRSTVSGCQQFDCVAFGQVTGTEEDCCSERQFTQVFDNCVFDDDHGGIVSLTGSFALNTDNVDVCTGAIPLGASFRASLSNFTHDVFFPDGGFSRTFQDLSESFEVTPGGCTVRQPEQFGFGIRGDGRRVIDGELQQFQSDGSGNVLADIESDVHGLEMVVGSTQGPDGCTVTAAVNGSLASDDFRVGTEFKTDLTDLHVVQPPPAGAHLLELNGTVGSSCLGDVTVSTVEPLLVASGDTCFTAGRLQAKLGDGTVSVTYAERGLDVDFGADGSVDQHFASCSDVPAEKCSTSVVGLCGACTAVDQCQTGLSCFPCSAGCTGNTRRCSLADAFVTCADGVF
jgi:hypothetical protein